MNEKWISITLLSVLCLLISIGVIIGVWKLQPKVKDPQVTLEKYEYGITCVDGIEYLYGHGHLIPYFTYDKITLTPKVRTCQMK